MPSKFRRFLINYQGRLYRFLSFELADDRDGSFYVNLVREGANDHHTCYEVDFETQNISNLTVKQEKIRKGVEISYHTTGLINYKNVSCPRIYGEPIYNITKPFSFMMISIPDISRLDLQNEDENEEDYIWELPLDISGRVNFTFIISPPDYYHFKDANLISAKISYWKLFDFNIIVGGSVPVPDTYNDHFIYASPNQGYLTSQAVDKDNALTMFHQKMNGNQGIIIYPPNKEGIWKIIHVVPMRIPPLLEIEFDNRLYYAEKIDSQSTKVISRFIVKDQHGHKIKEAVLIKSIALNAEL